ncbi:MAG: hypothetical protein ACRD1X_13755 [Vicinamibacteria bacterium]
MANGQKRYQIILKHPDGRPLVRLIADCEVEVIDPSAPPVPDLPARRERPNGPGPAQSDEPKMTDPQKRYLFRLLAQQGVEGKKAEAHLREHFGVQNLRDVSKSGASELIEQMIADQKEAGGGAA